VISKETNKPHEKHAKLKRLDTGTFGRNEIAIVGTTCANIRSIAQQIIQALPHLKIAYVDADHHSTGVAVENESILTGGATVAYTDKISFQRIDFRSDPGSFQKRALFREQDLVIVNGNHFTARTQLVVIDPVKNLEKKVEQLTSVKLILLKETDSAIPASLQKLPGFGDIPVVCLHQYALWTGIIRGLVVETTPLLQGLVLTGGQSSRMKQDKGNLSYHGVSQREYLYNLLLEYCDKAFVSCNAAQAAALMELPAIEDTFLGLGPMGGILSAMQSDPNAAWLTVACDLPYLSQKTISFLVQNRNPSKNATAFLDAKGTFPEPLVTIWEPKSYLLLLQFLAQGYSCPRKVLINSDIELLTAPDSKEFLNVNNPGEYEQALQELQSKTWLDGAV